MEGKNQEHDYCWLLRYAHIGQDVKDLGAKRFFFSEGEKLHHYYALDCMHAKQVAQHRCRESSRQPQGLTSHCHMTLTHMIFLFWKKSTSPLKYGVVSNLPPQV
jgi:hypothetical protein